LRLRKKGPRELRALGKVLITPQAEADWQRECETTPDDETIERLRDRGRKGGRSSVAKRARNLENQMAKRSAQ
jgi:hypothetical protein